MIVRRRRCSAFSALAAVVVLPALVAPAPARAQQALPDAVREAGADVLAAFRAGDLPAIESRFDATMRAQVSHEKFAADVAANDALRGPLATCLEPAVRFADRLTIVDYPCTFAKGPQVVRLVWNEQGELAGTVYLAAPPAAALSLPPNVRESKVTTGAKGWSLPGSLMMPSTAYRTPIVVLIAGSGPQDRDETIGPNKPLRDLAVGLAARGIASLRYDRRTYAFGPRFRTELSNWTLDDQIVDDAVAAVALAAARTGVGPVFVVGHSEGAWLAPRIAARAAKKGVDVAGIVMLAGNLTPLADLFVEQTEFASRLPAPLATTAMVDDARARRDHVRRLAGGSPATTSVAPNEAGASAGEPLPLDMPASAWLDIARYDPAATLLSQPLLPALLVFGGRDFQVPIREKTLWEKRLGARPDTVVLDFPAVNHLLMDGSGPMSPGEYAQPGQVDEALLDAIAGWIDDRAGIPATPSSEKRSSYRGIKR